MLRKAQKLISQNPVQRLLAVNSKLSTLPSYIRYICLKLLFLWTFIPWMLTPLSTIASEFEITHLSAHLKHGSILMNVNIDYQFSNKSLEALQHGIPLTVEVHAQLRHEDAWLWENDLLDIRFRYQVRYHPLAAVYQIKDLQTNYEQSFVTLESALAALGEIEDFVLLNHSQLIPGEPYILSVKSFLDIEALPLPLRPLAYIDPRWNLSSNWKSWRLQF